MAPKRVLMLHGYSQNASIFSKKVGALRKACGNDIEFEFVEAPHILQPADLVAPTTATNTPDAFDAPEIAAAAPTQSTNPAEIPRGWWRANATRTKYWGVEESVSALKDVLLRGQFEGVFGFSQGAAMAALLCALLERPHYHPSFLVNGEAPHPPMKFCVAVSGFAPLDPTWAPLFTPPYTTPTLHVLGANDVIVVLERGQTLVRVSENARVVVHDGGHFVPSKASWRSFFRAHLLNPDANVPAPLASASTPASGAQTPINSEEVTGRAVSSLIGAKDAGAKGGAVNRL